MGKRYRQDEERELRAPVTVGCAYVSGPKGGVPGNGALVVGGAPVGQGEVEQRSPAGGADTNGQGGPLVDCKQEALAE